MTRRVIRNKPNPIARLLKHFTPKRFQDKKKYNRKQDDNIWRRSIRKGIGT